MLGFCSDIMSHTSHFSVVHKKNPKTNRNSVFTKREAELEADLASQRAHASTAHID